MSKTKGKVKVDITYDKDMGVYTTEIASVESPNYTPFWVHGIIKEESIANAEHIAALWNASEGMSTKEAEKRLKQENVFIYQAQDCKECKDYEGDQHPPMKEECLTCSMISMRHNEIMKAAGRMSTEDAVKALKTIKMIADDMVTEKVTDACNRMQKIHEASESLSLSDTVKALTYYEEIKALVRRFHCELDVEMSYGLAMEVKELHEKLEDK